MDSIQTDLIRNEPKEEVSKLSSLNDSLSSIKNDQSTPVQQSNVVVVSQQQQQQQSQQPQPPQQQQQTSSSLDLNSTDDLNSANLSIQSLTNNQSTGSLNQQTQPTSVQQMSNNSLNNPDDLLNGVDNSNDQFNPTANGLIKNEFIDLSEVKNESSSPNSSILTSNINKLNKTNSSNNVGVPNNGNMSNMPCNTNSNLVGGNNHNSNTNQTSSVHNNMTNSMNNNMMNGPMINNSPQQSSTPTGLNMNTIPSTQSHSPANQLNSMSNQLNSMNNNSTINCGKMTPQPMPLSNNGTPNMMNTPLPSPMSNSMNTSMMNNNSMGNTNLTSATMNVMNSSLSSNNPIKNSNTTNSASYMQQTGTCQKIYTFNCQLANEAADAVLNNKVDTIIAFHANREQTLRYIEDQQISKQQHLAGWTSGNTMNSSSNNGPTNKRNKQSPCSMNGQQANQQQQQQQQQQNNMSPYGGTASNYRPPSNSSVVSNASYRMGPSPGLQNEMNNWNIGTPNTPNDPMNNSMSGWVQSPQQQAPPNSNPNNFIHNSNQLRNSMNNQPPNMMSNGSGPNLIREKKLEKIKHIQDVFLPNCEQNFNNFLNDDGMQRNWSTDPLSDQPNGPQFFDDGNCMMSQQQMPTHQQHQQPQTSGRRRKANQQSQQQSHVSPISSTLNSPNPNIAPSPNQQRQNPPPYSPANQMRLASCMVSPGPSTPSSMDGSKSMHPLSQPGQLVMTGNSMDQLNAPLSPAAKKCKQQPQPGNSLDGLDGSIGGDCFTMNSSLPNNNNNKAIKSRDQLIPVPSPQKIQYLTGLEDKELTIQRQPNTSLPESELIGLESELFGNNLDYMNTPGSMQPQQAPPPPPNHMQQQPPSSHLAGQPPSMGAGQQGPPPPQFMNNGPMPSGRMSMNSPFSNNGPLPPHLHQQMPPQSQMINQPPPPPPNQMMGMDNNSNGGNNGLMSNQARFASSNGNQFDPRNMQPHPSTFCPPNHQGPPNMPNLMNDPNNRGFSMYENPNSRMPPQQAQFKSSQLIGGPLISNPGDFNAPLNEPPMGSSNHLQNLQKFAHKFDDGPSKLDSTSSSLSSSQFTESNLMNNSNPMIRSNSGNLMMNNNSGSGPMNIPSNQAQQIQQQNLPGRLPPSVGNYSNPNMSQVGPPMNPNASGPNAIGQFNPNMNAASNSMSSDPGYQQMSHMPPDNYGKMTNYNQSPNQIPNVPGQPPVGFKPSSVSNQGHPMSGPLSSSLPNQGFAPNQGPPGPPGRMNSLQNMPPRTMNNHAMMIQTNNSKPSTIGYIPAHHNRSTGVPSQQRPPPNLEFLPNRYPAVNIQGPPQFQSNNGNNGLPPMISPNQAQMYRSPNGPVPNMPGIENQIGGGPPMHGPPSMNGNQQQMAPHFINPIASGQMSGQSFNPNSIPPMGAGGPPQSNNMPNNNYGQQPMMNKQPPGPQFYSSPNDQPPSSYDSPVYQNFSRQQMYATNQTGGN